MTDYRVVTNGFWFAVQQRRTFLRWSWWSLVTEPGSGYGGARVQRFATKAGAEDYVESCQDTEARLHEQAVATASPWVPCA